MKRYLIPVLLVLASSAYALKIQWANNPPADQVTKYTVYIKNGSTYTATATVTPAPSPAPSPSWVIPAPTPPGAQTYGITASNVRGESAKSDITLPDMPTAPSDVTVGP